MATEAQRLITVSLGKITSSRVQRGGVNLHKSLLVSCVLHKARSAFMVENLHAMVLARQSQQEKKATAGSAAKKVEQNGHTPKRMDVDTRPCAKMAGKPCDQVLQSQQKHACTRLDPDDKENTPPREQHTCEIDNMDSLPEPAKSVDSAISPSNSSCAKPCTKRRFSSAEEPDTDVYAKRCRLDNCESSNTVEPMQTESAQIKNLVSSFSSGFAGLLSGDQIQGLSACSTLIKDGFESLARPVIALAV